MASDLSSPNYAAAISSVETGGAADPYTTMGPATKSGDRAHGKYQIMGANIGPWSKEVLGQELTPEQFLSSPQLQDAVFQGKFGQYVEKYGPEGAAQAWFAGPGGVGKLDRKDVLGTSVGAYGTKFMKALGQPVAPQMAENPPPQMTAGAAQPNSMPAYGWSPNSAPAATAESQPSQSGGQALDPVQMMSMMGGPPRKPPDLSLFHALLQRPPRSAGFSFSRG